MDQYLSNNENAGISVYLVKIDVVIERYVVAYFGFPQPSNSISTNWQKNESHVELQGLSRTLCRGQTVSHNFEGVFMSILKKFPCEKPNHDHNPKCQNPNSPPILSQKVKHFRAQSFNWASLSNALQVLAQGLAGEAEGSTVVHVCVLLQQKCLQLPQLKHGSTRVTNSSVVEIMCNVLVN